MSEPTTTVERRSVIAALPANRYGTFDSEPLNVVRLRDSDPEELGRRLGVESDIIRFAIDADGGRWSRSVNSFVTERRSTLQDLRRISANAFRADETTLIIGDAYPAEPLLSSTPFSLAVNYTNPADASVEIVSVEVSWAGDPFTIQQVVRAQEAEENQGTEGRIDVSFDEEHSLPVGPVEFVVTLYRSDGGQATFRRGAYVLPANPLALTLGPAGARVTGSWSVRGDYEPASDTFVTTCQVTIANGDLAPVTMDPWAVWQFWDGAVGSGTLVESGVFDWPGQVVVPAFGVWQGSVSFSSPRGSGIFAKYERKEDLAIRIRMRARDTRIIESQITARVMLSYGVNVIKVGGFGSLEHSDLYSAIDEMRLIYERRDITLRGVDRRLISTEAAGSYTTINSEDEYRDLLERWSVPNNFVDVYVVQSFAWGGFNGYAGDIPGPASKGGRTDGVAVDKSGFVDASGNMRLSVTVLAQLIGHEVGHYLGLEHLENTNNLMRSNTGVRGPELDYDQYRTIFPHGFVFFD